jgi:hypothetical protein
LSLSPVAANDWPKVSIPVPIFFGVKTTCSIYTA